MKKKQRLKAIPRALGMLLTFKPPWDGSEKGGEEEMKSEEEREEKREEGEKELTFLKSIPCVS